MVILPPSPVAITLSALSASIPQASPLVPVDFPISLMASAVVFAEVIVKAPLLKRRDVVNYTPKLTKYNFGMTEFEQVKFE